MSAPPVAIIAIDWGTSSLRAYALDAEGGIAARREAELGIMAVKDNAFEAALISVISDWLAAAPEADLIMSGMIGSRQGWLEAPYVSCPADVRELSAGMAALTLSDGRAARIAPGLSTRDAAGVPDVMRGEEVQILGALEAIGNRPGLVCLPGTHSKWAHLDAGRVIDFSTHMTGEVFDALSQHTILARTMDAGSPEDDQAFEAGLARAAEGGGLTHQLFGIRAAGLFGELSDATSRSFLSGLLIGHEVADVLSNPLEKHKESEVCLIGNAGLTSLYAKALALHGRSSRVLSPDVAANGLYRLSRAQRNEHGAR